jgi:hypothetical protein
MNTIQILRDHFDFLDKDYELKPYRLPSDRSSRRWSPSIAYASQTTGVYAVFDVRDAYLLISLHELTDGKFPVEGPRAVTAQMYPLNSIIYLTDPNALIYSLRSSDSVQTEVDPMTPYFSECASKLKRYADDFLRGDFTRAPLVANATREVLERSRRRT